MRFKDAVTNKASSDCSRLSSHHPVLAVYTARMRLPGQTASRMDRGRLAPVRWEPEMEMNLPTQQSHSLCQCEREFAREKKKCSFIRAGFYLNDAFQLNSLKLFATSKQEHKQQGGLGSSSILLTERGKAYKRHVVCLNLTTSHRKSQTFGFLIPQSHFLPMVLWFLILQPWEKEHKNITHKSANTERKPTSCPLFQLCFQFVFLNILFCLLF